ncbi:hypothetical protein [Pseudovibrio axinellae]|nr:hypothetical protein [Pseudovibrio axinellae]
MSTYDGFLDGVRKVGLIPSSTVEAFDLSLIKVDFIASERHSQIDII